MSLLKCKMLCQSITRCMSRRKNDTTGIFENCPLDTANLSVVTQGTPENDAFFKATPSGTLQLGMHDQDSFVVGQEYYVTVEVVPTVVPQS